MDDAAGLCLERALLAADEATRLAEVERALAADRNMANWALSTAEARLGRTVNRVDQAAVWLAEHLVTELGSALRGDSAGVLIGRHRLAIARSGEKALRLRAAAGGF